MPDGGSSTTVIAHVTPAAYTNTLKDPVAPFTSKRAQETEPGPVAAILGLSGDSAAAVEELRERYLRLLADDPEPGAKSLVDIAYGFDACRGPPEKYRAAVSGKSKEELVENLRSASIVAVPERSRKVIYLFSGQGGQCYGMGGALYRAVPTFREAVDQCQETLVSWGFTDMLPFIEGASRSNESSPILEAEHTALFVLEYALARMWTAWGVRADVVLGQSLGEYTALVWSGVLSLEDGLKLVWQRARMARERCARDSSGMLVITADRRVVEDMIRGFDGLSMVCYNCDTNAIVGGDLEQIMLMEKICQEKRWWCRRVAVPYAFHTSCMNPILDELLNLGKAVTLSLPVTPVVSAVNGVVVEAGDASVVTSEYFAHHARRPVLFQQSIDSLVARDAELASEGIWLELGPHTTILPLIKIHGAVQEGSVQVGSMRRGEVGEEVLCQTLARLYCAGAPADWPSIFQELAGIARK
ncbi:FabD/lysophospholipase-like protein [Daedalea quercina L-15889]|uniref:FabD/lysophospholipase-like protein n=1 Tax=Daedalea quercina L-15889 TaxID=1314783 RepID=A0A165T767_9APHY|nr:FabD/lysophospholipase-like protein [Daedalea quercina L-15889]